MRIDKVHLKWIVYEIALCWHAKWLNTNRNRFHFRRIFDHSNAQAVLQAFIANMQSTRLKSNDIFYNGNWLFCRIESNSILKSLLQQQQMEYNFVDIYDIIRSSLNSLHKYLEWANFIGFIEFNWMHIDFSGGCLPHSCLFLIAYEFLFGKLLKLYGWCDVNQTELNGKLNRIIYPT